MFTDETTFTLVTSPVPYNVGQLCSALCLSLFRIQILKWSWWPKKKFWIHLGSICIPGHWPFKWLIELVCIIDLFSFPQFCIPLFTEPKSPYHVSYSPACGQSNSRKYYLSLFDALFLATVSRAVGHSICLLLPYSV